MDRDPPTPSLHSDWTTNRVPLSVDAVAADAVVGFGAVCWVGFGSGGVGGCEIGLVGQGAVLSTERGSGNVAGRVDRLDAPDDPLGEQGREAVRERS